MRQRTAGVKGLAVWGWWEKFGHRDVVSWYPFVPILVDLILFHFYDFYWWQILIQVPGISNPSTCLLFQSKIACWSLPWFLEECKLASLWTLVSWSTDISNLIIWIHILYTFSSSMLSAIIAFHLIYPRQSESLPEFFAISGGFLQAGSDGSHGFALLMDNIQSTSWGWQEFIWLSLYLRWFSSPLGNWQDSIREPYRLRIPR